MWASACCLYSLCFITYARANSTGESAAKVVVIGRAPCRIDVITMSLMSNVEIDGVLMRLSIDVVMYVMFYVYYHYI